MLKICCGVSVQVGVRWGSTTVPIEIDNVSFLVVCPVAGATTPLLATIAVTTAGTPVEQATAGTSKDGIPIVFIAAGAGAAIVLGVLLFVCHRRRKEARALAAARARAGPQATAFNPAHQTQRVRRIRDAHMPSASSTLHWSIARTSMAFSYVDTYMRVAHVLRYSTWATRAMAARQTRLQ